MASSILINPKVYLKDYLKVMLQEHDHAFGQVEKNVGQLNTLVIEKQPLKEEFTVRIKIFPPKKVHFFD